MAVRTGVGRGCRIAVLALFLTGLTFAESPKDELLEGFSAPPESAKPRVWWHWVNGNVTETGIGLDLAWLERIGIGGVTNIDVDFTGWGAAFDMPAQVEKPLVYLTPEWQRAFRYSFGLANK